MRKLSDCNIFPLTMRAQEQMSSVWSSRSRSLMLAVVMMSQVLKHLSLCMTQG